MPQYYSSDMPTMAPTSDHLLAPSDSPSKTKRDGRPPLEHGLSERSLDSVTMRSIATTASMLSSDRSDRSSGSSADELERRRSSLQTESVVALKIFLAEAQAEAQEAKMAAANAKKELDFERTEARRRVDEAEEEVIQLRREYQGKLVTLGQTLEKQSYELASVIVERNELREQLDELGARSAQRPGAGAKAPSNRTLFQQQGQARRRQGSLGSYGHSSLASIEEPATNHRRRNSLGESISSRFNESVGNLMNNISISGGLGSRRTSNEDQRSVERAEDMLWSNRNLVIPEDNLSASSSDSLSDDDHEK